MRVLGFSTGHKLKNPSEKPLKHKETVTLDLGILGRNLKSSRGQQ